MLRSLFATLMLGATALVALPADAQENRTQDQEVVITGQKEVPPEVARQFVRSVMTTFDGQLARFVAPVCPIVIGLPDDYADRIADRIKHVARAAGADVPRKPKCQPNIIVIVARDADALVKQMRRTLPGMFAGVNDNEMRRALRSGPAHVWNAVQTQNEDGDTAKEGGLESMEGAPTLEVRSASIINLPTRQAVLQSVVVLDAPALVDKSLYQIADYVAMRTLAGARPPKDGLETDSILTLFNEGATPPLAMTSMDQSYLRGIYKMRPNGRGTMQRSSISRQITRDSRERTKAN